MGEFSEEEAEELLRLPLDGEPALDPEERQLARQWGGRHPLLLQQAALSLWEARQDSKSIRWAKKRFEGERRRMQQVSAWKRPLSWKAMVQGYRNSLTGAAEDAGKCRTVLLSLVLPLVAIIALSYAWWTEKLQLKDIIDFLSKLVK